MPINVLYTDVEIRILELQQRGYPVELTLDGERQLARGFLDPSRLPWIAQDVPADDGEALFRWLFADEPLKLAWAQIASLDHPRRIRLRIDAEAPELHTMPWELLRQPAAAAAPPLDLAADAATPFSRYLALPGAPGRAIKGGPLKILVAIADPVDLPDYGLTPIDRAVELEAFFAATANLPVEWVVLPAPCTLSAIETALRQRIHILHLFGHGVYSNDAGAALFLANDDNRVKVALAGEIVAMLSRIGLQDGPLRLAFLASCQTATTSPADAFRGLAPQLLAAGLPAVLAMQDLVAIVTAQAFAATFYRQLLQHGLVDLAANQARAALLTAGLPGASIPVLFQRVPDGKLFDVEDILPIPACPYPGMAPFGDDGKFPFYGRDDEIEQLLRALRLHPFIAVIGPSGSGKSSLVAAGLAPRLRKSRAFGSGEWDVRTLRPGPQPLDRLKESLGDRVDLQTWRPKDVPGSRLLLIVDQFEETFTQADDSATAFQEALGKLISAPGVTLVLTVRADFYANLLESPLWPQMEAHLFPVRRLGREGLRKAIVQPAEDVGVSVEPDLVERLLADAGDEPGILPFIQETLVLLWDRLPRRALTLDLYEALVGAQVLAERVGLTGLQVAMAQRADAVLAELPAQQTLARRIFLRLVQFGEGRPDTRRQQAEIDLRSQDDDPAVFSQSLEHLIRNRLVTADGEPGDQRQIDIAHEALFLGWPTLRRWIDERRGAEQTRRRLEAKAGEWIRLGRQTGGLLDEVELLEAGRWLDSADAADLGSSAALAGLVSASRQNQDDIRKKERAAARFRMGAVLAVAVSILAAVGIFAAGQANLQRQQKAALESQVASAATIEVRATAEAWARQTAVAERNRADQKAAEAAQEARRAKANALVANVRAELARPNRDPSLPLLLAREAVSTTRSTDGYVSDGAKEALADALFAASPLVRTLQGHEDVVYSAYFSPDGQHVVTASLDRTIRIWNVSDGKQVLVIPLSSEGVSASYNPDGQHVVTADYDGRVQIWDATTGDELLKLPGEQEHVWTALYSPKGDRIVTAGVGGIARIWDADTGSELLQLAGHEGALNSAAFSYSGDRVVTAGNDKTARIWDANTGQELVKLQGHGNRVLSAAFSPDDTRVVTASYDQTARVWDAATGEELYRVAHPYGAANTAVFSPRAPAKRILTAGGDGNARLWDATSGRQMEVLGLFGHKGEVMTAAYNPAGDLVVTAGEDHTARIWKTTNNQLIGHRGAVLSGDIDATGERALTTSGDETAYVWDLKTGEPLVRFIRHDAYVNSGRFSPDGDRVATAGDDGLVRIWDPATGKELLQLAGHEGGVYALAFSPDGLRLVTGGEDQTARVWEARTGEELFKLTGHDAAVMAVGFSPDGRTIVTSGDDATVRLWDAVTGTEQSKLVGHGDSVWAANFSPDGTRLVTASADGTARIWDVASGKELRSLVGHEGRVLYAAFSADGSRIITAGEDGTARLWDAGTGDELFKLMGHDGTVYFAMFFADGQHVLTGSSDWTARIWPVSLEQMLDESLGFIQRDPPVLTVEERNRLGLD